MGQVIEHCVGFVCEAANSNVTSRQNNSTVWYFTLLTISRRGKRTRMQIPWPSSRTPEEINTLRVLHIAANAWVWPSRRKYSAEFEMSGVRAAHQSLTTGDFRTGKFVSALSTYEQFSTFRRNDFSKLNNWYKWHNSVSGGDWNVFDSIGSGRFLFLILILIVQLIVSIRFVVSLIHISHTFR